MALQDLWYAREATAKIGTAIGAASIITTESLSAIFDGSASGSDYSGRVKDVRITGGDSDVEIIHLFGNNQAMEEKRAELRSAEFTLIYQDEDLGAVQYGAGTTITYGGKSFTRIQGADNAGCRTKRAILLHFYDCSTGSSEEVNILINNCLPVSREISLAGDGSVEETMTAKCLITDYYEEYAAGS